MSWPKNYFSAAVFALSFAMNSSCLWYYWSYLLNSVILHQGGVKSLSLRISLLCCCLSSPLLTRICLNSTCFIYFSCLHVLISLQRCIIVHTYHEHYSYHHICYLTRSFDQSTHVTVSCLCYMQDWVMLPFLVSTWCLPSVRLEFHMLLLNLWST